MDCTILKVVAAGLRRLVWRVTQPRRPRIRGVEVTQAIQRYRADAAYHGLLPAGSALNTPGCGFQHTSCGNTGGFDLSYPNYEPYGPASIGEYGLHPRNGNVLCPRITEDRASYCRPAWISLYEHERLIQHLRLDPGWTTDVFRVAPCVLVRE